jgi:hypothetical protein
MKSNSLHIAATDDTPEVKFSLDSGKSSILGRSLPENAYEFYRPIITWLNSNIHHIKHKNELELSFDYFNSSSSRYLFEMLNILERSPNRRLITIRWKVEKGDELMFEKAQELSSLLDLNFQIEQE